MRDLGRTVSNPRVAAPRRLKHAQKRKRMQLLKLCRAVDVPLLERGGECVRPFIAARVEAPPPIHVESLTEDNAPLH